MKYLSLFSGIGGFELGIGDRAECIGFSEIDKYAVQIYQKHFPEHKNYGDITNIAAETLPDFDLIVGGFPCQAFSIAGRRKGFDDTRGTLFFEIARIIRAKRPRLLLLENVKGLLSHDGGRTFEVIISTLDDLGYDAEWQVLNSKNHGVPQNRERVFIVGYLRGSSRPEVFPLRQGDRIAQAPRSEERKKVANTLRAKQGGPDLENSYEIDLKISGSSTRRGMISQNGYAKTLDHNCAQAVSRGSVIRKLTPLECERLQGFPDHWTEGISDTQRYKTLGNGVTVNVVRDIAMKIL